MINCNECDLRYEVTWHYDVLGPPVNYCPRCGSSAIDIRDLDPPTMDAPDDFQR